MLVDINEECFLNPANQEDRFVYLVILDRSGVEEFFVLAKDVKNVREKVRAVYGSITSIVSITPVGTRP